MLNEYMGKTPVDLIRNVIAGYYFVDMGIVKSGDITKVTVDLITPSEAGVVTLEDVELLTLGSAAVSVTVAPKAGDLVLLLGLRRYIEQLSTVTEPLETAGKQNYNLSCVKAVQIAPAKDDSSTIVAIDESGSVDITAPLITINGDTKPFVTHAELQSVLSTMNSLLIAHTHAVTVDPGTHAGAAALSVELATMSADIASAATTTIKTGG